MSESVFAGRASGLRRPSWRQGLAACVLVGAAVGFATTQDPAASQAVADAGVELTRLLRAMAALKVVLALGVVWLVGWRLRFPIGRGLAVSYLAAAGVMATGPGLIWSMAHVVLGAALLHGAGAILIVLFLRDPGSPAMTWAARRHSAASQRQRSLPLHTHGHGPVGKLDA